MLRIVGRRADGYHLLQTVFQFLDVGDSLQFLPRDDGLVRRLSGPEGVPQDQDLVVRAAGLLRRRAGTDQGVDILLEKKVPMGAGLGGGSSDAATTLVVLNRLWGTGLSTDDLADLGLELGADVPVFVRGRAAWGEGVGEDLKPVDLQEPWYLVLVPPCHVSTAEIFTDPNLTRNSPRIKIRDFLDGNVANDCLPVVCRRYPQVREAMDWLGRFSTPRMTGTGAGVFAAFGEKGDALNAYDQAPERYRPILARGMNRSLLYDSDMWAADAG